MKMIELRADTERLEKSSDEKLATANIPDKWTKRALIVDCETTLDQRQCLTFGCYRYCQQGKNGYQSVQEGFFHADDLNSAQTAILREYGKAHGAEAFSRSEFIKRIFWQAVQPQARILGCHIPFDLSRLALEGSWSTRRGR